MYSYPLLIIALIVLVYAAASIFRTVPQATVAVVTLFGRYQPHHA